MGWSFTHRSKGTTTEDFFKRQWGEQFASRIKATATKNGVFYAVFEAEGNGDHFVTDADGKYRTCLVILIKWDGDDFGYKDMDESMGPCEATCPKRLLDMLSPLKNPDATEDSSAKWVADWRRRCRAEIERAAAAIKLTDGLKVKLPAPLNFSGVYLDTFTVTKINRKTLFRADNGWLCRIPKHHQLNLAII